VADKKPAAQPNVQTSRSWKVGPIVITKNTTKKK